METNELIKLAEECDAQIHETVDRNFKKGPDFIVFLPEQLQQFAQRYRTMVLLEAAKVCDDIARTERSINQFQWAAGADECIEAIKEMAEVQNGN